MSELPPGWRAGTPDGGDVIDLVALLSRHEQAARGWAGASEASVAGDVVGLGAATRTHLLLRDEHGRPRAWASGHDRAAGRVLVGVTVDPELDDAVADSVAATCFAEADDFGRQIARERGRSGTQLDSGAFEDDERQHRWLEAAGYTRTRRWWQMSRPVRQEEATTLPTPRAGVQIRRVRRDDSDGMPEDADLRAMHLVLEESFADHFNSYRESFEEFVARLRESPGHRWDHWWLAMVDDQFAGGLVASAAGSPTPDGSYVDYIGVHRDARGRGVAKALLHTVIADAAARGREQVGLEVDADSPTGADGLYRSMGWETRYVTESWHKDVLVEQAPVTG